MFAKLKSKWVLMVIGVLIIIVLIVVAVFIRRKSQPNEEANLKQTATWDEPAVFGELPQKSGAGSAVSTSPSAATVKSATPTPQAPSSPAREIGYMDWSQNLSHYQGALNLSPEMKQKAASGDYCKMANIANSWDDPFSKTMCGLTNFVGKQIFEPLDAFLCQLEGSHYALNLSGNISVKYISGMCLIEDR